jgi:hypothetical protein
MFAINSNLSSSQCVGFICLSHFYIYQSHIELCSVWAMWGKWNSSTRSVLECIIQQFKARLKILDSIVCRTRDSHFEYDELAWLFDPTRRPNVFPRLSDIRSNDCYDILQNIMKIYTRFRYSERCKLLCSRRL